MKKLFTFFLLLHSVFFGNQVFGQDKILDRNGNERTVIVTEITPDSVFYKEMADSLGKKVYSANKRQLFMVTFKNGTKAVFPEETVKTEVPQLSKDEYYRIGQQDASNNFKSKYAFWGTFTASLVPILAPIGGIAAGTAISLKNPSLDNVKARKPELKQNADYIDGYNNRAKKKKLGSAAGGFVAGTGVLCTVFILSLSGALK